MKTDIYQALWNRDDLFGTMVSRLEPSLTWPPRQFRGPCSWEPGKGGQKTLRGWMLVRTGTIAVNWCRDDVDGDAGTLKLRSRGP